MFISWISQMVALLDKPEGGAVHDILLSLASDYPQVRTVIMMSLLLSGDLSIGLSGSCVGVVLPFQNQQLQLQI